MTAFASSLILALALLTGPPPDKSPAPADSPFVKLPAAVKGDPGAFVRVTADTNGKAVAWRVVDPGLNLFPVDLLKDTKTAVVTSSTPGVYRLWAYTAIGDAPSDIAECTITIGTPAPPVPPAPPTPVPSDPLTKALQAAYTSDADGDRAKSLAFLQVAYASMARSVPATATTNAAVLAWMKSVVDTPNAGLTSTQVVNLRKAIGAELLAAWGASAGPLANADAAAELNKIATALQGVK